MQVILIKDIDTLGSANELVNVKPGYARNYLIPHKYAVEANNTNKSAMEGRAKSKQKQEDKLLGEIAQVAAKLNESPVKVIAKSGTSGKIFGAVTSIQIARAIREQKGYEIDRKRITILDEVRELGLFKAQLDFGKEPIEMEFEVIAETTE
jgi:large subunit ribosomal protein L9